ncbi:MAG: hypothetical protein IRD7MM_01700 [Candidatus Midichloria mitochondrii]|nr:HAD-IC family P-type ATPase [Candidatus Midichloria mitochondrii]MDJ1288429.1 HAD-IC family P-type ATPase [Candidatus Midichloria mitochondrii]MDJ1299291.1 HAD-IC family P-type ATPase [Candidatus Midichloria mitochondrii]MDJ1312637.1 HAD-IC family P-type ATPase [Candidatus Midichloria mitochondrii]MDJ1583245.1 HAD-IC family P-type ATPase [Candidatus Midichloria mitochondrii]
MIFEDSIRKEALEVIEELRKNGYEIHLLSGDRSSVVQTVAGQLNISDFKGLLRPEDKFNIIKAMQKEGKKVLMVGDGLNDSPALQLADASLSPSAALAITSNNADIVFKKIYSQ